MVYLYESRVLYIGFEKVRNNYMFIVVQHAKSGNEVLMVQI